MKTSALSGFYKLSLEERLAIVKRFADLTDEEAEQLKSGVLPLELASRMIENVVGTMSLPYGIATNFLINGKEYLIPMVIEEASVVAAASNGAKVAREGGGFTATATDPIMIGQIQIVGVSDPVRSQQLIVEKKEEIIAQTHTKDPAVLVKYGGGLRDISVRTYDTERGPMLIVYLHIDVRDAMGANAVNTIAESLAPTFEKLTGGKVRLRIISNLASYRIAKARARFPVKVIGADAVEGILDAATFAQYDIFRCATHNKGIMNGVSAVVLATGNDTRAMEAGAHAYATYKSGRYSPLTRYWKDANGDLMGEIEIPVPVGTVGGLTKVHPHAKISLKILGVSSASELGMVLASVGLAQNFAALRALATVGIQQGHMELHARNIAMSVGASPSEADIIAAQLIEEKRIRMDRAKELLEQLRTRKK